MLCTLKGSYVKIRVAFQEMQRCLNKTQKEKKTLVMESIKLKQEDFS